MIFTQAEDNLIRTSTESYAVLAAKLGRTKSSVRHRAIKLKTQHKKMIDLRNDECRWPLDYPMFCASPCGSGAVYCAEHVQRAYKQKG